MLPQARTYRYLGVVITDDLSAMPGQLTYVPGSATLNGSAAGISVAGSLITADYAGTYGPLPPGTSIGKHRHGQDEELYLVLEGEGLMELDGVEFPVRPGSVILNKPHGTHGLRNTSQAVLKLFVVEVRA